MIQSMTAFARLSSQGSWGTATWEIRSVNQRYFDCSIKLPETLRQLETAVRLQLQEQLHRGRIECFLKFQPGEQSGTSLQLNVGLLKQLAQAAESVKNYIPTTTAIDPMKLLAWPQLLQIAEEDISVIQQAIMQLFQKTLTEVVTTRSREGEKLGEIIQGKLQQILVIAKEVKAKVPECLANYREKLLSRLAEVKSELDSNRLEQEMVLLAQRIDVAEELDRLEVHGKEIERVLRVGGVIGKRLDFLLQELNREANTLASKSISAEMTQAAVELKVLIEQIREQIQNVV